MDKYKKALMEAGLSEQKANKVIAAEKTIKECLDKSICPKCGETLSVKKDPRQAGPSYKTGTWYNYRCSGCGYMVDWKRVQG